MSGLIFINNANESIFFMFFGAISLIFYYFVALEYFYRIIKDEATFLTALRTGQLDILESIRWIAVDHLKETTPELQWNRWLGTGGTFVSLRVDQKPFDDVRVRRAMNLAINQQEIADVFYGGHAELMAYPQHPDFGDYFQPLSEMPEEIRELFTYNPEKAKAGADVPGFDNAGSEVFLETSLFSLKQQGSLSNR